MKRPPFFILIAIPILVLGFIWLLTFAFMLMRAQSDMSVVFGVVILFIALLALAIAINFIKNKYGS